MPQSIESDNEIEIEMWAVDAANERRHRMAAETAQRGQMVAARQVQALEMERRMRMRAEVSLVLTNWFYYDSLSLNLWLC